MNWLAADYSHLVWWLDIVGIYIFGLSGAMLAVRRDLDLFGIIVLATAAATAGGAIRDMMIGDQPAAMLREPSYLASAFASGVTVFFFHRLIERANRPVMLMDAIGLGVFTVAGTSKALAFGLSPAAACLIGVLTACGGGMLRDLLVTEIPRVLREEVYAVAAAAGGGLVVLGHALNWPIVLTACAGAGLTIAIRLIAMRYGLRIPRAR
ncbi:trimeric intracellular cation channel family protein [Pseudogemmobacter faecipullorum]|uniref:Trimeric intracellular cation channel family protein n=1 Tax=Pseudogemmobacter faecipullorum TaxID=2755041 RepID=A0ABS8CH13_9RHOB|nr:trimeric intracellular cation channel family protein [Pseudogemmobacter faecipullorum]MCB5408687.1 trimeric intracellular cation channel family protein [Pseudogemmobacter faecipullorum]